MKNDCKKHYKMPTKYKRRMCPLCKVKHVAYKMPSLSNETGTRRIFICWECARRYYEKLTALNIMQEPDKKFLLSKAFKIPGKRKQEIF
jgi:hypothetical protein